MYFPLNQINFPFQFTTGLQSTSEWAEGKEHHRDWERAGLLQYQLAVTGVSRAGACTWLGGAVPCHAIQLNWFVLFKKHG